MSLIFLPIKNRF